ncbi:hypothetical protein Tco_1264497 [Tanacetum coccineum]
MTHPSPRRNMIPQDVLMRSGIKAVNTAKTKAIHNGAVKGNRFNAIKASTCWVWMPNNIVIDHVSKNNSASVTLNRFDYIDAQGRFKWMHRLRGGMSMIKNLMQKLLLLEQKLMILLLKLKCTSEGVQQRQKIKKKGRGFPERYGLGLILYRAPCAIKGVLSVFIQLINTAYPLPLDTAYRSSGTETDSKRHFKSLSLDELRSPDFNLFSDQEYSEEEEAEAMAETMEQYMSKTRTDYGSGVARPKIEEKDSFELKGQFLKELRENTFSGSDNEDANEHIEKVLEIVDLFHVPNITVDQLMLRVFPISLTGAASRWLRNEPTGSIKTWEDLKTKFLNKYCPPGRTAKKMKEINNFQQQPYEPLYQAWEHFKELLMKCPQHYLTKMQEVILLYNGLDVPTRQILDSRGAIPTKTAADAKKAIQEMAEYSQK